MSCETIDHCLLLRKRLNDNAKCVNQSEYPGFFASAIAINGSVTPLVIKLVLITMLYALAVAVLCLYCPWATLSVSPFEYAGLVMGLVLVFRINAGYERWWEARKLWGTIIYSSRNLAIIVSVYTNTSQDETVQKIIRLIASMPYLMRNNLRLSDSIVDVCHLLDQNTYLELQDAEHRPAFISTKIACLLNHLHHKGSIDHFAFMKAEESRAVILDCQGACERILKTPIPFVMAVKARRFILLFLMILPFAIADIAWYVAPFITGLVAYALYSLDQIGIELQNPFSARNLSHLPLGDMSAKIEKNVFEIYQKFSKNQRVEYQPFCP